MYTKDLQAIVVLLTNAQVVFTAVGHMWQKQIVNHVRA